MKLKAPLAVSVSAFICMSRGSLQPTQGHTGTLHSTVWCIESLGIPQVSMAYTRDLQSPPVAFMVAVVLRRAAA